MSGLAVPHAHYSAAPAFPSKLLARLDRARWDAGRQPGANFQNCSWGTGRANAGAGPGATASRCVA